MKLLNKTSIYYFLFALPVFIICSVLIYYFISSEIRDTLDESLWKEKTELEQKINSGVEINSLIDDEITIEECKIEKIPFEYSYSDTSYYDKQEEEIIPFRVLTSYLKKENTTYKISLYNSVVESDDLAFSILVPIIILFVALLIGFLFINYWISKKLWSPFYKTIQQLRSFQLDNQLEFNSGKIKEFNELNQSLNLMTAKVYSDYLKQKEFTENASHEIQTPLAIILNKIELLIQSKRLAEEEMELISGIYESATRLSQLNKTLLLLTKIENNQFADNASIQLSEAIQKSIATHKDAAEQKNITITADLNDDACVTMNKILCETLFNNLIQNAIRHNVNNGNIYIQLQKNKCTISNTGTPLSIPSEKLFDRFKKESTSNDSTGLGLAIVRSISDLYAIKVDHQYINEKHIFTLGW